MIEVRFIKRRLTMKRHSPFTQHFDLLPNSLPIFPLANAIVLPGELLPLNIFEPRYLSMFKDAMKGDQLIGMIQPRNSDAPADLFTVGCAARVTRYEETLDGRLEVMLTGLCRFEIAEELSSVSAYRIVRAKWDQFKHDYDENEQSDAQTSLLFNAALRRFFKEKEIDFDWKTLEQLSLKTLANNLVAQLPLSVADKQLLLESKTIKSRVKSFIAILEGNSEANNARH